jgi:hypothetical protein
MTAKEKHILQAKVLRTDRLAIDFDRLTKGERNKRGKQPRNVRALHLVEF